MVSLFLFYIDTPGGSEYKVDLETLNVRGGNLSVIFFTAVTRTLPNNPVHKLVVRRVL